MIPQNKHISFWLPVIVIVVSATLGWALVEVVTWLLQNISIYIN